jgi:hypothetical protein
MTMPGKINQGRIELLEPVGLPDGTEVQVEVRPFAPGFWENLSAAELARRQQVKAARDLSDLAGDWPAEDSLEEFLESVRKARH